VDTRLVVLAGAVFVTLLLEAMLSRRHERALRRRGAIEPANDVHRLMAVAYPGAFLAMVAESVLRGSPPHAWLLPGVTLFVLAKAVKYSAIRALGERWTFRVLVLPGEPLVVRGPYRFMRHPNYVGVAGELVGSTLAFGAWVVGPLATILFLALVARRMAVEEAALARFAPPRRQS